MSCRTTISVFSLTALLLSGSSHALRLTDGLYFTVAPNSSAEVYFILPDDVGAGLGKADYFINVASNWSTGLTKQTVSTEENNTVITPVRFYSADKKEGDCSNFTVSISAPSLQLLKTWKGGVCLSKYMDVDISKKGGDPKSVLNNNVDLFSMGFRTYTKNSKPGESVPVELLMQSQANLMIDVNLDSTASLDQKAFAVQTNQGSQYKSLIVNATASSAGSYDIVATAKARGCSIASCTKQTSMKLVVSGSESQEGFSVSVFPENLAVKNPGPIPYRFTLQNNYRDEVNFVVDVSTPPDLDSSFILGAVTVPGLSEKTVNFTVTPRNQTGFYEIKVRARVNEVGRIASAYLSTNEMVSDVYRNADDVKANASPSTRANVDRAVGNWYSSYTKSEYGSNITGYASLQQALDAARKINDSQPGQSQPLENNTAPDSGIPEPGPSYLIFILPAVLAGAVLFILLLLRKRKQGTVDIKYLE